MAELDPVAIHRTFGEFYKMAHPRCIAVDGDAVAADVVYSSIDL